MKNNLKRKFDKLVLISLIVLVGIINTNFLFASSFQNNAIKVEVNSDKGSYEAGETININIKITNKNRYGKLYYRVNKIDSNDSFKAQITENTYKIVEPMKETEISIMNTDNHYYKGRINTIGFKAPEIKNKLITDDIEYIKENEEGKSIHTDLDFEKNKREYNQTKIARDKTNLIKVFIIIIIIIVAMFLFLILKCISKKHRSFFLVIGISSSMVISLFMNKKTNALDIYKENEHYKTTIQTNSTYGNIPITFSIEVEYYYVNDIVPITDIELDTDNDNLPDYIEVMYLTDLNNPDTDGDGLSDGDEVYHTHTDPLREDTDNNGILDGDEDYDKDGLKNIEEKNHGTAYDNVDTDEDKINDFDEINGSSGKNGEMYITNPLNEDSDEDGLLDGVELIMGLNPTSEKSDGITLDSDRKIEQTISKNIIPKELSLDSATPISFNGNVKGFIDDNVKVRLSTDKYFDDLRGRVGNPIAIDTTYEEYDGLKVVFDITKYKDIMNKVRIFKYSGGQLSIVKYQYITDNTITGVVSSGIYVLVDTTILLQEVNMFIDR